MKTCIFDNPITGRRTMYQNGEESMSLDSLYIDQTPKEIGYPWLEKWRSGQVYGDINALPDDLRKITLKYPTKPELTPFPEIFPAKKYGSFHEQLYMESKPQRTEWQSIKDKKPDGKEPIVYARPRGNGKWGVGIAYWTVSDKWNPEAESQHAPEGFTHWMPLPHPPTV